MFENIVQFLKNLGKSKKQESGSKTTAKERLHLVLMQDRANVSADFLDMMKQEIIDVIKKYIDIDEEQIDVRLTNKSNEDGTTGAPALYANIPIISIKEETKRIDMQMSKEKEKNDQAEEIKKQSTSPQKDETKSEDDQAETQASTQETDTHIEADDDKEDSKLDVVEADEPVLKEEDNTTPEETESNNENEEQDHETAEQENSAIEEVKTGANNN